MAAHRTTTLGFAQICTTGWQASGRMAMAALLSLACMTTGSARAQGSDAASPIAIEPATQVTTAPAGTPPPLTGYFSDPYPVHLAPWFQPTAPQFFTGTTKAALVCEGTIQPGCFGQLPITVSISPALQAAAKAVGSVFTIRQNNNAYMDDNGAWQMATTIYLHNPAFPNVPHWDVLAHAHPVDPNSPTAWVADSILVGSLSQPAKANYDGKYFADNGTLYLLYSKRLSNNPARDGIVAQRLESASQAASEPPTVLLAPQETNGGFNSEFFFEQHQNNDFKLVETGNVTKVDGKYAMAYSTGAYDEPDYKAAVAWSDTFLPKAGTTYRKVLQLDAAGVWGQPNHEEVRYLLQAQQPAWPNYVAGQVKAPGVPSLVQDPQGNWRLFFAGLLPSDSPLLPGTQFFDASHRRPFYVDLQVNVPSGATVAGASDAQLAGWIVPVRR